MTWSKNTPRQLSARISLAKCFARSGQRPGGHHFSAETLGQGLTFRRRYVRLVVRRPADGARVCFSGMSARSAAEAAKIAFCEYLEAQAIWNLGSPLEQGRSGWATFSDPSGAQYRAYKELVERDAFLTHFLSASLQTEPVAHWLPQGFSACALQSADPELTVVLAGRRQANSGVWLLGMGCALSASEALRRAVLEVSMLQRHFRDDVPPNPQTVASLQFYGPHLLAAASVPTDARLRAIFAGGGGIIAKYRTFQGEARVEYEKSFGPFAVARLSHPRLLPLTFGQLWDDSQEDLLHRLHFRGISSVAWARHPFL